MSGKTSPRDVERGIRRRRGRLLSQAARRRARSSSARRGASSGRPTGTTTPRGGRADSESRQPSTRSSSACSATARRRRAGEPDPGRLREAMRYAVLGGGKRLRPASASPPRAPPAARRARRARRVRRRAPPRLHPRPRRPPRDGRRRPPPRPADGARRVRRGERDPRRRRAPHRRVRRAGRARSARRRRGRRAGRAHRRAAGSSPARRATSPAARPPLAELERIHAGKTGALFAAAAELGAIAAGAARRRARAPRALRAGARASRSSTPTTAPTATTPPSPMPLASASPPSGRTARRRGSAPRRARRARRPVKAAALAVLAACASSNGNVLARGTLAYGVAAGGPLVASVELDTRFRLVLRAPAGTQSVDLGPPDYDFVGLAVDGAGRRVAVAGLDGTVRLFFHEGDRAAQSASWRLDAAATAVALAPDGAYLAHGSASGVVCLRRVADGALLQCVAAHEARVTGLAFADAKTLVSAGADGRAVVWEVPSLKVLAKRDGAPVVHLAARGPDVALARIDSVETWRWRDDQVASTPAAKVSALVFLPDGRLRTETDPKIARARRRPRRTHALRRRLDRHRPRRRIADRDSLALTARVAYLSRFGDPQRQISAPVPADDAAEMAARGWDAARHPHRHRATPTSITRRSAPPLIARFLEGRGFKVGIIAQPDWHSRRAVRARWAGRASSSASPPGNLDSMLNKLTAQKKIRGEDQYSPGRPHRPAAPTARRIVYAQPLPRRRSPACPSSLGGIEASLRRIAHYDYWSRPGPPLDPRSTPRPTCSSSAWASGRSWEIARPARRGRDRRRSIRDVRGTALRSPTRRGRGARAPTRREHVARRTVGRPAVVRGGRAPTSEAFARDVAHVPATRPTRTTRARSCSAHGDRGGLLQPARRCRSTKAEMDELYDLPFSARAAPDATATSASRRSRRSSTRS